MRILLVSMPWALFNRPSIQLGALSAYLSLHAPELQVRCSHPYLETARLIGRKTYRHISENNWAGEALYSGLLFPEQREQTARLFDRAVGRRDRLDCAGLQAALEGQCSHWVEGIAENPPALIGFSICFSQLLASLYAATRIKALLPEMPIVFGGSTCTAVTARSLLHAFSCIDYAITGEGETALVELCRYLDGRGSSLGNTTLSRRPTRTATLATPASTTAPVSVFREIADLNQLPLPDYRDYFAELRGQGAPFIPVLPLEFSRGCWWNKCSFCNLNLQWRGYRFKSAATVRREVLALQERHQCLDFTFTDNALPPREADRFFAEIGKAGHDLSFFAEIRTITSRETLSGYARGGLSSVQVGIEALSDSLLARMRKGVSAVENIAAMKGALGAGIRLDGNLILEFPGSTRQEVEETLLVLQLVLPFRPLTAAAFFLGQGSPVCCRPGEFGIRALVAHPWNSVLFPAAIGKKLVHLIQSYRGDRRFQRRIWQPVRKAIKEWADFHAGRPDPGRPALSYRDGGDFLLIRQELPGRTLHHRLRGASRQIYLACEEPLPRKELLALFPSITREQMDRFLAELAGKRLLFSTPSTSLALAVRDR